MNSSRQFGHACWFHWSEMRNEKFLYTWEENSFESSNWQNRIPPRRLHTSYVYALFAVHVEWKGATQKWKRPCVHVSLSIPSTHLTETCTSSSHIYTHMPHITANIAQHSQAGRPHNTKTKFSTKRSAIDHKSCPLPQKPMCVVHGLSSYLVCADKQVLDPSQLLIQHHSRRTTWWIITDAAKYQRSCWVL